jgi:hypothetical protein
MDQLNLPEAVVPGTYPDIPEGLCSSNYSNGSSKLAGTDVIPAGGQMALFGPRYFSGV